MESKRLFFVIPPDVHLLDITGPAHIFYELREMNELVSLHFLRLTDHTKVSSSAGLMMSDLEDFTQYSLSQNDIVFIPGIKNDVLIDFRFIASCQPFFRWLQAQHLSGATICSVCTGAFLLAEAGLLHDKSCTTHWRFIDQFKKRYPRVDVLDNRLFVQNNNIYTSAGIASGLDLSLHLITEKFGPLTAARVAKEVVVYHRRGSNDPQLSVYLQYRNHIESDIHKAQDYLTQNLAGDCSLATVSRHANMSPRNLSRRFKQHAGLTVGEYLKKLRIEKAKTLLDQGLKTTVVANEIGLKSTNQLRALLKE